MAQANAQIGEAEAAYFPSLTLSASADSKVPRPQTGSPGRSASGQWVRPSRRPSSMAVCVVQTVAQYRAAYDQAVATYRQNVLTAFQQVEDNLAALRILSQEIAQQDQAVSSSQRYVNIATGPLQTGPGSLSGRDHGPNLAVLEPTDRCHLAAAAAHRQCAIDRGPGWRLGCIAVTDLRRYQGRKCCGTNHEPGRRDQMVYQPAAGTVLCRRGSPSIPGWNTVRNKLHLRSSPLRPKYRTFA